MGLYEATKSMTIPAGAGTYAPEVITLAAATLPFASPPLLGITVLIESAPATAQVELWLLHPGADPSLLASYYKYDASATSKTWALAGYRGALLRGISGGTSGTMLLSATAD